jgi:hypothetical protein
LLEAPGLSLITTAPLLFAPTSHLLSFHISGGRASMSDIDTDRIDDAVLALLLLGLHDGVRAWKGFDWDAMNRLHRKGFISDPVGKAKSVVFTEAGLTRAEALFQDMFSKRK